MGSSGSGGGGDSTYTIRYAPYIEAIHTVFLNDTDAKRVAIEKLSPYAAWKDLSALEGFFGV